MREDGNNPQPDLTARSYRWARGVKQTSKCKKNGAAEGDRMLDVKLGPAKGTLLTISEVKDVTL